MSQPNQPAPLSQQDQDALVKQIGIALIRSAPQDWQHIDANFGAVGRHFELSAQAFDAAGDELSWTPDQDAAMAFARLRAGMHGENGGTWFNARYTVDHPSSYNLEFDRSEPRWNTPPPPQAYRDELQYFPRSEDHVPEWLMRRLAGMSPERAERKFRIARIFDHPGPDGRPAVDRPEIDPTERERLLTYLERSTIILPVRGRDIDRLAPDGRQAVPVAFHSDGTWIWHAAVGYYLRNYGTPPESGLVEHARSNGFAPAEIDQQVAAAAAGNITGSRPSPPPQPAQQEQQAAPNAADAAVAPEPAAPPVAEPAGAPDGLATPAVPAEPRPEPEPAVEPEPHPGQAATAVPPPPVQPEPEHPAPEHPVDRPPEVDAPHPSTSSALATLRTRLAELGVPAASYRIEEPPQPHTWYLEQVADGWQVGWYEREFATPVLFDDAADAAAFLLGKLLLSDEGTRAAGEEAPIGTGVDVEQRDYLRAEHQDRSPHPLEPEPAYDDRPADPPVFASPAIAPPGYDSPAVDEPGEGGGRHSGQYAVPEIGSEPPARPEAAESRADDPTVDDDSGQQAEPPAEDWSIRPLPGEPPLTLFHKKQLVELPAGAEIDRHGNPDGNLGYDVGTPFPERSLPPDWEAREYHVYRLQQPVMALEGEAIPWFEQPGGGVAYLLPYSVEELLASGDLAEVVLEEPGRP